MRFTSSWYIPILVLLVVYMTTPFVHAETEAQRRARLEKELAKEEQIIFEKLQELHAQKQVSDGITTEIEILTAEIERAQLSIRSKNLSIQNLTNEMVEKEETIESLSEKIIREKESLAQLVRNREEFDSFSLAEIVLSTKSLSGFLDDLENYTSVKSALHDSLSEIRTTQDLLAQEKQSLDYKRKAEADAKYAIEQQKAQVEAKEDVKQSLLAASKSEEQTYEQVIAERRQRAAQIRAQLFNLRDAGPIQFGDALAFAEAASAKTGVRTAFILGILKQESNLGQNVGQCYLRDPETGSGVGKNTGTVFPNVMKPSRDVEPFLRIAQNLGFDPYSQVVSCPQSIGYGGAMGPSQFIPSTWVGIAPYVESNLGVPVANPWIPEHAFMATAVFLQQLGAGAGGYSAEREAAGRYYAGGNWQTYGLGYAASVLSHAENIQSTMIDPIKQAQ